MVNVAKILVLIVAGKLGKWLWIMQLTICLDQTVGKVVNSFKRHGFWEDTILIFSSDNGGNINKGASNYPLKGHKGSLNEGSIRSIGFVHSNIMKGNHWQLKKMSAKKCLRSHILSE